MRRRTALLGSILFLVVAPGTVALFLPWLLCRWRLAPPFMGLAPFRAFGILLILAGLPVVLDSFWRFASQGLGTPAPIAPTQHLVVTGAYRFVRNPMYVAVLCLIFGQAALFGSAPVLQYGIGAWATMFGFVKLHEEPVLLRRFGADYARYRSKVPGWIPRLRPYPDPSAARP